VFGSANVCRFARVFEAAWFPPSRLPCYGEAGSFAALRASRVMPIDSDNPLAFEIRQEMAAAYFAACKKMVASLEALKTFDLIVASSTLDNEQIMRRSELLEEAGERVHFVVIQREAMQLSCFEGFFKDYEIPDEVRNRMGPKRLK
jgi:hypothetical protein